MRPSFALRTQALEKKSEKKKTEKTEFSVDDTMNFSKPHTMCEE